MIRLLSIAAQSPLFALECAAITHAHLRIAMTHARTEIKAAWRSMLWEVGE